jgi:outer membrane protein TolC
MNVLLVAAILLTLAQLVWAADGKPDAVEHLPQLVAEAIAQNPELKASEARWRMFAGKVKQAGSLEDPMLMFRLDNLLVRDPLSFGGRDPTTAKVVGISQQLPFWGKRGLREELAQHEAEAYRWTVEERKLELTRMVKETYYQLYAVDRALQIVGKNLGIISDLTTIAESRYAVGQGVQTDIFKANLERSKMLDMQLTLQQQRASLAATMNFLLNRPASTPIGTIAEFELPAPPLAADQLQTLAQQQRPQLHSLHSQVNKAKTAHQLARKEVWPDANLSFEYMFRERVANGMANDPGYDMFTMGLTFNLPLQQERRRAMQAESASETSMASEELNNLKNSIRYSISDNLAQLERRARQTELYRSGIIPQAAQTLESALIGYRVGKVDFPAVLEGRLSLFNYERELLDAKADYMISLARLEAIVGGNLVPPDQFADGTTVTK